MGRGGGDSASASTFSITLARVTSRRLMRKLTRAGESLLARPPFLTPLDEVPWDARVWSCLEKIADHNAFEGATQLDNAVCEGFLRRAGTPRSRIAGAGRMPAATEKRRLCRSR